MSQHRRSWPWVPSFAGTTAERVSDSIFKQPLANDKVIHSAVGTRFVFNS